MKSPLVDALRNATGRSDEESPAPESEPQPIQDDDPEVGPKRILLNEAAPDADPITLMEATDDEVIRRPTDNPGADMARRESIESDPGSGEESARPSADGMARIAVRSRRLSFARAARFSPVICLLLGIASTGAYWLFHDVGRGDGSAGLAALPAKLGTYPGGGIAGIPEPQGPLDRFPLIESGDRPKAPGAVPTLPSQGNGPGTAGRRDEYTAPSAVAELAPPPAVEAGQ